MSLPLPPETPAHPRLVLPAALVPAWGHRDMPKAGCPAWPRGMLMTAVRVTPAVTPPGSARSFKRCFGPRGVKFILNVICREGNQRGEGEGKG